VEPPLEKAEANKVDDKRKCLIKHDMEHKILNSLHQVTLAQPCGAVNKIAKSFALWASTTHLCMKMASGLLYRWFVVKSHEVSGTLIIAISYEDI
jgi:hypothetical protein